MDIEIKSKFLAVICMPIDKSLINIHIKGQRGKLKTAITIISLYGVAAVNPILKNTRTFNM